MNDPRTTAWEPTIHELNNNPASPWVLVRSFCGHLEYFRVKRSIKRFISAQVAQTFADGVNKKLDLLDENKVVENIENG